MWVNCAFFVNSPRVFSVGKCHFFCRDICCHKSIQYFWEFRCLLKPSKSLFFIIFTFWFPLIVIHFLSFLLPGGFYSDTPAYVDYNCLHCENGTFVHYNNAPGKSPFDCKRCPEGDYPLIPSLKEPYSSFLLPLKALCKTFSVDNFLLLRFVHHHLCHHQHPFDS